MRCFKGFAMLCALFLCWTAGASAQVDSFQSDYDQVAFVDEGLFLQVIDSPTAEVLRNGQFLLGTRLMDSGSVIARADVGIRDRLSIGVSWGMTNLLGRGEVESNKNTGLSVRFALLREMNYPGLAVGFTNQGFGFFDEDLNRYERKSKGFYAVTTRHWYGPWDTEIVTSGGINYSTENTYEDSPDAFFGFEQIFDGRFSLLVDYSLGLDDRKSDDVAVAGSWPEGKRYGNGLGWLDIGLCWTFQESVQFKFLFRDLLSNFYRPNLLDETHREAVDRQFLISYVGTF